LPVKTLNIFSGIAEPYKIRIDFALQTNKFLYRQEIISYFVSGAFAPRNPAVSPVFALRRGERLSD
jgi:hypothetical protein